MKMFRQAILGMVWWLGLLPPTFFLVLSVTTFFLSALASRFSPNQAPPPPSPPVSGIACDANYLHDAITMWVRYLAKMIFLSAACTFILRIIVEALSDAEQQAAKQEEEVYEAAKAELKEAKEECLKASKVVENVRYGRSTEVSLAVAQGNLWRATLRQEHASEKDERSKPKQGLNRLPGCLRKAVRGLFILAIVFSLLACFCAFKCFYYSLQLEVGCVITWLKVLSFSLIAVIVIPLHLFLGWIAITQF